MLGLAASSKRLTYDRCIIETDLLGILVADLPYILS